MYLQSTKARASRILLLIGLLILTLQGFGQKSREQLEKEKQDNLKKIEEAQNILKQTESRKKNTLGQLNALNHQVEVREELISSMESELTLINKDMDETAILISSLEADLDNLKEEYGAMIYSAYKAKYNESTLLFLFSSGSFNQLVRRLQYLNQYSEARRNQVREITMVMEVLEMEVLNLQSIRAEKSDLLEEQVAERKKLEDLRKKQQGVITQLNRRQRDLRNDIASRKEANDRLASEIDRIIREEIARREREAEAAKAVSNALNANMSATFEGAKTKLDWPVSSGFISMKYGKQPHPANKRLVYVNNGIDIQTKANEDVKAVFNGKVSAVVPIPGMNNAVFIRHGDYLTVYANLSTVKVQRGDDVAYNQVLGEVFTDRDGVSQLHFEIWKNTTHLNPQLWLAKR